MNLRASRAAKLSVPWTLCLSRFLLGPLLVWLAGGPPRPWLFLALLLAGLLSDILDGLSARRLGVATVSLRVWDSRADLVFWLCTALAAYRAHPEVVLEHAGWIAALVASEASTYLVGFVRFGKPMSTHALLAKVFGLSLFGALTAALCFGVAGIPFYLCMVLGIAANTEIVIIAFILPEWQADVPTWRQALRIRRGLPVEKSAWFN